VGLRACLTARYAWLDRVHRVSGDQARDVLARERNLDSHAFNLAWKRGVQQVVGYAYLHDDRDVATASTATWGLRAVTDPVQRRPRLGLALEWAQQGDYADNPLVVLAPVLAASNPRSPARHHLARGWGTPRRQRNATRCRRRWRRCMHSMAGPTSSWSRRRRGWRIATWRPAARSAMEPRCRSSNGRWPGTTIVPTAEARTTARSGMRRWASRARQAEWAGKLADYRSDGFARDTTKLWLQLEWAQP
jgi:hypothetical protein